MADNSRFFENDHVFDARKIVRGPSTPRRIKNAIDNGQRPKKKRPTARQRRQKQAIERQLGNKIRQKHLDRTGQTPSQRTINQEKRRGRFTPHPWG